MGRLPKLALGATVIGSIALGSTLLHKPISDGNIAAPEVCQPWCDTYNCDHISFTSKAGNAAEKECGGCPGDTKCSPNANGHTVQPGQTVTVSTSPHLLAPSTTPSTSRIQYN